MGHCNNCGRPCPVCSAKADKFDLLSFNKDCRRLITLCLEKIGLNNPTDQSILLKGLGSYRDKPLAIESALRNFMAMKRAPRSLAYIIAITKNNAVRKKEFLDALPPLKEYSFGKETSDEISDGDNLQQRDSS